MKKKIAVVTGTRAEYGILRSSMDAIAAHPDIELRLIVIGMHTLPKFGFTQKEIEQNYKIDCVVPIEENDSQIEALAKELVGIGEYLKKEKPNCILVLGDRDEPLAAAIAAAHLNIPIAHIHGGDVTGPGVDEANRHAITKMAHLHFPATKKSGERIAALGEEKWRITTVGTPGLDMVGAESRLGREVLAKALALDGKRPWLAIAMHPTAFDDAPLQRQIDSVLEAIVQFPEHEKIIGFPNNDTGNDIFIAALQKLSGDRYHVFQSLKREEYINVIAESEALIGNSSSGLIEAPFLGTPTVNVGSRQKGREHGDSVLNVPYDAKEIVSAIQKAIDLKQKQNSRSFPSPYGSGEAGKLIVDILAKQLMNPELLSKKSPREAD